MRSAGRRRGGWQGVPGGPGAGRRRPGPPPPVLGEDHPDTLASAHGLAISLRGVGEGQAARELDEDTLARRRRVLGEDHPDTLTSASNLAMILGRLGEYQAARELAEDTLARRRRVLGDRHPDTMASAAFALILSGLAADPKARAAMETLKAAWSQHGEGREPDG